MAYNPLVIDGGTEATAQRVTIANDSTGVLSVDDNGGSLTVDGTITANIGTVGTLATAAKQDTGNTSLASIDGKITAVNTGAVVVSSSALPSGASTAAKQDTGNTSLGTIAGAVSGTEMQVDIVTMPTVVVDFEGDTADLDSGAGTDSHAIVALGVAASGGHAVITGDVSNGLDVDVTRVGGTVAVTQSGTWDEVGINDSGNSITVDGTVAISGTPQVVGSVAHDGVDGDGPVKIGGYASAAAPTNVSADADRVNAWYLRNGAAATVVTAAGALIGGDASNGLDVDVTRVGGTVAVTQSGTWDEVGINDSGNSITVDGTVTANLAAGTNNIGDVDVLSIAAGDNNIGNVDVVTMPATGVEDAAETAGGALLMMGAVRRDTAASSSGTTGDNSTINTDANGALWVSLATQLDSTNDSVACVQSGTWDEVGINDSGNSITVDNAQLSVVGSGTEATAQRVTIASDSTGVLSVDDNGGSLTVDGTITANAGSGTFTIAGAVTNAGTFATQVDGAALTALQLIDDPVFADDAAFTIATSKVMVAGGVAVETDGTDPTSTSAEGDAVALRTDRNRRLLVNSNHPNSWKVLENHSSAQTNNNLKAAPGASLSLYITDIIISNGATAGSAQIVEDEGGTPVTIGGPYYFAVNGGIAIPLVTPIRLTANKSLGFTSTTVTTHTIELHGYTAP